MNASLVYQTLGDRVIIPEGMAMPKEDQMQSTLYDQVGELACRTCYDSLGTGRSSEALHKHIRDVINLSVYEHITFTVHFNFEPTYDVMKGFINRKGLWFEPRDQDESFDLTVNARTVLEWQRHTLEESRTAKSDIIGQILWRYGFQLAPLTFQTTYPPDQKRIYTGDDLNSIYKITSLRDDDLSDRQIFITLWLYGSRGFTHEQVRHRFAISQRSTRYVDESDSPYIEHPVITAYLNDPMAKWADQEAVQRHIRTSTEYDRATYDLLVTNLQEWLVRTKGLDKTPARKQARGAARGYLGNALASEMLFTASMADWQWILRQRKNALADAEIRQIYTPGLKALQESMWSAGFADFETVPSPDSIGTVLK